MDARLTASGTTTASVRFDHVSIEFPIYSAHGRSLKRSVLQYTTGGRIGFNDSHRVVVSALGDVSIVAKHGEHIGLIGHNGAGKSTMLRAIAGAYEPVRGTVSVCGRVSSLIDLTLGMDMEASGYENIRIRSMMLGLDPQKISAYLEDVAELTELGDFLAMPVRTYSSGMMLRLAFAISTSVTPDILLMDEWIGTGDASFMKKAQDRLQSLLARTGILFIASHSEAIIKGNCTRAIWFEQGAIRSDGTCSDVWREYQSWSAQGVG